MNEGENTFPMDFYVQDSSPRPWKFRPTGYLVVILSDADEAERGEADLVTRGFAPRDVKLYTGRQILENYEVYAARRKTTDKVVGSIVDDSEGRELYLDYARQGRSAMWVRIPNEGGRAESSPSPRQPRLRSYALLRLRAADRLQGLNMRRRAPFTYVVGPSCIACIFFIMTASAVRSSSLGLNDTNSVPGSFCTGMWPGGV